MPAFNARGSAAFLKERKEKYIDIDIKAHETRIETARYPARYIAVSLALSRLSIKRERQLSDTSNSILRLIVLSLSLLCCARRMQHRNAPHYSTTTFSFAARPTYMRASLVGV